MDELLRGALAANSVARLLDFRTVYSPKPAWRIEGYVTNITNKLYAVGVGGTALPYIGSYYFGPPRLFGVAVRYSF